MDRNYRTVLYLIVIFLWLWLLFLQYSTAVPAGNTYGDPNRARQESRIVWYTNIPASDAQPLANAFEKKYSIKVEIVRGGSEALISKLTIESRSERYFADIFEFQVYTIPYLKGNGLIVPFCSSETKFYPPEHKDDSCYWTDAAASYLVPVYNTGKISRENLPERWEDFIDPMWKNEISTSAHVVLYQGLIQRWGKERAREYIKNLSQNGVNWVTGQASQSVLPMVVAGETSFGIISHNLVESLRKNNAPLEWLHSISPIVSNMQVVSLARNAPHPEAAKLFIDFLLSKKGQEIKQSQFRVSGRVDLPFPVERIDRRKLDVVVVQPEKSLNEYLALQKEFLEIIGQ